MSHASWSSNTIFFSKRNFFPPGCLPLQSLRILTTYCLGFSCACLGWDMASLPCWSQKSLSANLHPRDKPRQLGPKRQTLKTLKVTIQKQGGKELPLGQSKEQPVSFNCQKAERRRAKEFTLSIQHSKDNFLVSCWGPQILPVSMCLTLSSVPQVRSCLPNLSAITMTLSVFSPHVHAYSYLGRRVRTTSIPETPWCAFPHAPWTSLLDGTSWCKASRNPVCLWADWPEMLMRNPGNCASLYNTVILLWGVNTISPSQRMFPPACPHCGPNQSAISINLVFIFNLEWFSYRDQKNFRPVTQELEITINIKK